MNCRMAVGGRPLLPGAVAEILPPALVDEVGRIATGAVEELRLKADRNAWITCEGQNLMLRTVLDRETVSDIFVAVCGGSVYAHAESIKEGYVTMSSGVRVGVVGRAASVEGKTVDVREIGSLCFRIPGAVCVKVDRLIDLLAQFEYTRGLLLYSPPGGGKTTVLRNLARGLASGTSPRRVVVVDTRGELAFGLEGRGLCVDILSGYPRSEGIEIATRTMGAEIVICDEIGGERDAEAILRMQGGGAVLIASAHAADIGGLLSRKDVAPLHQTASFGAYVRVDRRASSLFDIVLRDRERVG